MQYSAGSLGHEMLECHLYEIEGLNNVPKYINDVLKNPKHVMLAQLIMALMLHL